MRKFFKENIHHVISFVLILIFSLCSVFDVYKISYANDFKDTQKKMYDTCVVFKNGGDFGDSKREEMDENKLKWHDDYCDSVIDLYKDGATQNVDVLFVDVNTSSEVNECFIPIIFLLATLLSLYELNKLNKTKKRIKLADAYKAGLKSLWVGPTYALLIYFILFVLRGPFNPMLPSGLETLPLLSILVFYVITNLFVINISIFVNKIFKNKFTALLANIVILLLLYYVVDIWTLGLIGLGIYGDLDYLTGYSMINYAYDLEGFNTNMYFMLGRCALTFVFAYLAYNNKLNKKFIKK